MRLSNQSMFLFDTQLCWVLSQINDGYIINTVPTASSSRHKPIIIIYVIKKWNSAQLRARIVLTSTRKSVLLLCTKSSAIMAETLKDRFLLSALAPLSTLFKVTGVFVNQNSNAEWRQRLYRFWTFFVLVLAIQSNFYIFVRRTLIIDFFSVARK